MECLLYSAEGAGFSGYNPTLGAWGDHYAGVVFLEGQIQARLRVYGDLGEIDQLWVPLVPYLSNTWYRIRSVVDLASRSFDVYVDGQLIGQGLPIMAPGLPLGVEVSSGDSFWVDDVKVVSAVPQTPISLQLKSTWRPPTNSVHVVQAAGTSALVGTDNGITHLPRHNRPGQASALRDLGIPGHPVRPLPPQQSRLHRRLGAGFPQHG